MAGYTMLMKDIPTPKCWDEELTNIEQIEGFNRIKEIAKFKKTSDTEWVIYRPVPKNTFPYKMDLPDFNMYKGNDVDMFKENPGFDMYVFMWRWVNGLCPDCGKPMEWDEGDKSIIQQCTGNNLYNTGCTYMDNVVIRGMHYYHHYGYM